MIDISDGYYLNGEPPYYPNKPQPPKNMVLREGEILGDSPWFEIFLFIVLIFAVGFGFGYGTCMYNLYNLEEKQRIEDGLKSRQSKIDSKEETGDVPQKNKNVLLQGVEV